jgi:hypothetical protein
MGIEDNGTNNSIGGATPGAGNVISANFVYGIWINSGDLVQGNYIGTDSTGTKALGNGNGGISVGGNGNTIGGASAAARNIISANGGDGISLTNGSGNLIQGNFIGLDSTGNQPLGNSANGIELGYQDSTGYLQIDNTIGGISPAAGNVISGNKKNGVLLNEGSTGNLVQGNDIGTNSNGTSAVGNGAGVVIDDNDNTIGGAVAGEGNLISGNATDGVVIDSGVSGVSVQGNFIGTDATGTIHLANATGIEADGSNTTIGGSVAGAGNVIADNSQAGVLVYAGGPATIRSNSIYANGSTGTGPGISLNDGNGNNNLAAPSLDSATLNGNSLTVTGSFNSPSANNTYVLEFFANSSSDAEGRVFLGSLTVTPTTTGVQTFTFSTTNTSQVATYPLITATLTDNSGDTSAFSNGYMASAPSAPTVTNSPASQTVTAGQDAAFTASANGNPTPTVQWQVSIDGGKTFTNISGATSTTLTLNNATTAMNGYEYQAVFTNSIGSAATSAATLTVNAPAAPAVTSNPSSQTVTAGQNATFTASASGSPTPTVQWQVSTDGGKTFTNIFATGTTLTLNNVSASQNGNEYQAVFSNSVGTATTAVATLTVQYAPTVTTSPTSATVTAGQTATFTASASGNPTPTVQWQVSSDGGKTFTTIAGATSTTLTLTSVTAAMNGYEYEAVFTNSVGNVTTSATTLTVNAPESPVVTSNPSSQTVTARQSATFTASASGNPTPTVQWQVSTDGGNAFTTIAGATGTTLTLTGVTTAMSGYEYQAVFTNSVGSATTSAATLTVNALAAPAVTSNPSNQAVVAGQNATFTASASGNPAPTVQWQVSTDGGGIFTNIPGATSTTLTLNEVTSVMSGYQYEAVFTNSAGSATTSAATLAVNAAVPVITRNPISETVVAGQTATFTASGIGNPAPTVQWQLGAGGPGTTDISGATSTTLMLFNVTTAMNGNEYEAVFTNSVGSATTSVATLTVIAAGSAPTITENPSSQTVTAGQTAVFTAFASGNPTPMLQWQVSSDGGRTFTNISGATSTTLMLNNVTAAMSGYEYEAIFTNSAGSATTSAATLTVPYPPGVTANPKNQTVTAGQTAIFTASAIGSPSPTVQWQVSADGGKTFTNITGATSTTLTLNNVTAAMSGYEYEAIFTNSAGSATTSAATLTVNAVAPIITSNPSNQTVTAGQSATFTVSAGGSPTPTVQWQVSSDGGKTFTNISGATNITLTLYHVTIAMNGYEYQAIFTNSAGSAATSAATLTVNPDPPPSQSPPPSSPLSPPAPPVLNVPPMLAFLDSWLGGIATMNANGTETITDSFLGIPLIVSTFDAHGDLMSVDLFGSFNITFLFV